MSTNREELQRLVDGLADDEVEAVLTDVRRRTADLPSRTREPFSWFGMVTSTDVPTDLADRSSDYLEGFGAEG
ncbi:hypothetical protein [Nocardioides sp.]|uniref:hypothetical protein n=1 Tax=Nocardioides sp. TaxID=35761 RepID=UPI002628C271|nr:hypothetical protein [Nocardioides sp.]